MAEFLRTARLTLRRLADGDLVDLAALHGDPEVMAFLGPPHDRAAAAVYLAERIAQYEPHGGLGAYAAIARHSGEFLGWMALTSDGGTEVALGYRLNRSAWGHGYATEGSRALVEAAFTRFPITRVYAQTMAVNTRSRAVMERAGLRYVRTFHLHFDDPLPGTEFGEVEYALTRPEWRGDRG